MHLVFLSYHYSPDIQSPVAWFQLIGYYKRWAEILAEKYQVTRIDQINFEGSVIHNGINYHFIREKEHNRYIPTNLNKFVRSISPDIVVVSSFHYPLQLIQLRRCLGNGVRILVQNHAEHPYRGLKKWIQNLASHYADAFLFTNPETGMEWVRSGNIHSKHKIAGLPEVSSSFFPIEKMTARKKTESSGSPVFIWVGRLNQNKDPVTAVKAFLRLSSEYPLARLYMIYQTEELLPDLIKTIEGTASAEPVVFVGSQDQTQMPYWYNSAEFFLSASHHEGSGTALCEALSCGCIPIVSNIPPFRLIAGSTGVFFKPGDEDSLLNSLREAMTLDKAEKRYQALQHFNNELSFESIAKKFQEIISTL
jgi:glycosyltransferase involved in cell wall biosynthesis